MDRQKLLACAGVVALAAVSCAPSLAVAPKLVASWPSAGASMPVARQTFDLTFNRRLEAHSTWAGVWSEDGARLPTEATVDSTDSRHLRVRMRDPGAGRYELRWHVVAADSHLATDGDQGFDLQDEATMPPRLDISPFSADTGEQLELIGKGFSPDSSVQLTIGDDEEALATAQTDDAGAFDLKAPVPPTLPFGMQPVAAVDAEDQRATGSVDVRWGGWPPLVATDAGQPGPERGEVTFTVNMRNLSDYVLEHVRLVLQDPDGATLVSTYPPGHRRDTSVVWDIATMDRGQTGPIRATYRADHAVESHAWLEFRHRRSRDCAGADCLPAFISNSAASSAAVAAQD